MKKEFSLSQKGVRVASIKAFGNHANGFFYYSGDDVKEFIKREGELLKEFEDLMLQPNTKSKNFIEISDFLFYLNNFYYKRNKLT